MQQLALLENARIMEACYGYAAIEDIYVCGYVLPVHIRDLREPAKVDPESLYHPFAIELENKLVDKLQGTG